MNVEIYKPNFKLYIGIPILIFTSCYLVTLTNTFKANTEVLSYGIIADLLLTAPLVYYFIIRNSSISNATILRVFLIGVLVSSLILNSEKFEIIHVLKKWISPVIELIVFLFIIKKFHKLNSDSKREKGNSIDFLFHCRDVFGNLLGNKKLGNIVASEISTIYYLFFYASKKTENSKFTSYKESGVLAVLYALLMVLIIETITMHFVFALVGDIFAWILTGLSLYTCLQFIAHIRAIKLRPSNIENNILYLHMGLAADVNIDISNIKTIELTTKDYVEKDLVKISLLKKLESHNVRIDFYESIEVIKMFGLKTESKAILFFVDSPKEFKETIITLQNKNVS